MCLDVYRNLNTTLGLLVRYRKWQKYYDPKTKDRLKQLRQQPQPPEVTTADNLSKGERSLRLDIGGTLESGKPYLDLD